MKNEQEAIKEIRKFEKAVLDRVIKLIEVNQGELNRILKEYPSDADVFHRGSIAFGDVLIHEIKRQLYPSKDGTEAKT